MSVRYPQCIEWQLPIYIACRISTWIHIVCLSLVAEFIWCRPLQLDAQWKSANSADICTSCCTTSDGGCVCRIWKQYWNRLQSKDRPWFWSMNNLDMNCLFNGDAQYRRIFRCDTLPCGVIRDWWSPTPNRRSNPGDNGWQSTCVRWRTWRTFRWDFVLDSFGRRPATTFETFINVSCLICLMPRENTAAGNPDDVTAARKYREGRLPAPSSSACKW